jgi:hypothetical protein
VGNGFGPVVFKIVPLSPPALRQSHHSFQHRPYRSSYAADLPAFRECAAAEEKSSGVGSPFRVPLHQGTFTSGTRVGGGGFWGIPSPRTELRSASRTGTNRSGGGALPTPSSLASEAGVELVRCGVEHCWSSAVPPRQTTHRASRHRHRETLRSGSCGA